MRKFRIKDQNDMKVGRFHIVNYILETDTKEFPYNYVKVKKGVTVVPMYQGKYVLIRQYRIPFDSYEYEFPAGMIDEGELPNETAIRELKEETGLIAKEIDDLGYCYPSVGSTDEVIYLYYANCESLGKVNQEDTEDIEVLYKTKDEVLELIKENKLRHASGIIAFFKHLTYNAKD